MTTNRSHTCRQLGLAVICWALAACAVARPSATPTPIPPARTATHSPVPVAVTLVVRTATATPIPSETPTPRPTRRPTLTPSPMPSALPTKTILVAFRDVGGGDGGWPYEHYLGNFLPNLIIYTDGQMLTRLGDWYWETYLTPPEICTLLDRIQGTGFMQLEDEDDIYEPGIAETIGDGAPTYSIYVNGDPAVSVGVSIIGMAHVIPQVAEMRRLLLYYRAPGSYTPYISQAAVLWVERGRGVERWQPTYYGPTPEPTPAIDSWPADLPPLASMLPKADYEPPYFQGELAQRLSGLPKRFGIFSNFGQEYLVIVRPMLPHERTPNGIYDYSTPAPLDLPFACN